MRPAPMLVSIDTKSLAINRYVSGKRTHSALCSTGNLDAKTVEGFRTKPPEEFFVIASRESFFKAT